MKVKLVKSPISMSSFNASGDKILYAILLCAANYGLMNVAPGFRLMTGLYNVAENRAISYAAVPVIFALILIVAMVIVRKMEKSL